MSVPEELIVAFGSGGHFAGEGRYGRRHQSRRAFARLQVAFSAAAVMFRFRVRNRCPVYISHALSFHRLGRGFLRKQKVGWEALNSALGMTFLLVHLFLDAPLGRVRPSVPP